MKSITLTCLLVLALLASVDAYVGGSDHDHGPSTEDLHGGKHCSDISYYQPVEWGDVTTVCCHTEMVKLCTWVHKEVCLNVTDMLCNTVAWADCKMEMHSVNTTKCEYTVSHYDEMKCNNYTEPVTHYKNLSHCEEKTQQNCVTSWEIVNGKKVWSGDEVCSPVTWQECELRPTPVIFNVSRTWCEPVSKIPYMKCYNETIPAMANSLKCEEKSSRNCVPTTRRDCDKLSYQECVEVPTLICEDKKKPVPFQTKVHQKKCLLPQGSP